MHLKKNTTKTLCLSFLPKQTCSLPPFKGCLSSEISTNAAGIPEKAAHSNQEAGVALARVFKGKGTGFHLPLGTLVRVPTCRLCNHCGLWQNSLARIIVPGEPTGYLELLTLKM